MQTALRLKTTVLPGGKIEINATELAPGESVEVIILMSEPTSDSRRSAVDILAEAPGHRLFNSADEVDSYLRTERDEWDR
jgi:hypothetical protein